MTDLRELYQEVILDHNRRPRNRGRLDDPTGVAEGHNPLCGDNVTVTLRLRDGRVDEIAFDGVGCAVSTASASLMTEAVKGKTLEEAESIFRSFQSMVTDTTGGNVPNGIGDLEVLAGVRDYPVRIKCATLPWHTMRAALQGGSEAVTTE
ncbi:MAG TPA: SUF system NifU family Fe-S cluster assembly protein [Fimbriimonas sp.]|nr:SUF system NifU family Fe-S cluster assembly protein [Fimbriimonas sp.]